MGMRVRGVSVRMRGTRVKMREKMGDQGDDARNQVWNLSIAVEMSQNSKGNDKFKEWREVKIIENKHVCKNLVSHICFY